MPEWAFSKLKSISGSIYYALRARFHTKASTIDPNCEHINNLGIPLDRTNGLLYSCDAVRTLSGKPIRKHWLKKVLFLFVQRAGTSFQILIQKYFLVVR
jgi:hypothetical protein